MLSKLFSDISRESLKICKFSDAEDISSRGALPCGTKINIELTVSRRIGASGAVLRLMRDGEKDIDTALDFCRTDNLADIYSCTLDTEKMCGDDGCGLFYYDFKLICGTKELYTDTYNNVDFHLSEKEGRRFRLLVYEKDFSTPEGFGRGVMYQIFTDRFFKGESQQAKTLPVRDDAIINEDWEHGIPQYSEYPGASLKNNMFFGGNLWGVAEKLDYLNSLGVKYIYLCPIFEAYSNHKYDTSDYEHVDPMFGGDEAFDHLLRKAKEKGIGIILDGVFNHTGSDSVYFNKDKNYGEGGAYNDPESPFRNWYYFKEYPCEYESWWGFETLPKLNHGNDACRRYFTGKDGIIQKYIKKGIAGWRLDVADELCNEVLDELRQAAKEADPEAVIIGEVWENAADKVAYGERRRYFSGRQLDSVMNYPLKNAIISFCLWGDGGMLYNTLVEIYSSYPTFVSNKLMNLLGTHDTERILTVLGGKGDESELSNPDKAVKRLDSASKKRAARLLKIASVIQYTVYGIPSVFYGDEIGMEGYGDPFCRMPFPWHESENSFRHDLCEHYRKLGEIRCEKAFDGGDFYIVHRGEKALVYVREKEDCRILVAVNRGVGLDLTIPESEYYIDLLTGKRYKDKVTVDPDSAMILKAMPDNNTET